MNWFADEIQKMWNQGDNMERADLIQNAWDTAKADTIQKQKEKLKEIMVQVTLGMEEATRILRQIESLENWP